VPLVVIGGVVTVAEPDWLELSGLATSSAL